MDIGVSIIITIVLVLLYAYFSLSEAAVSAARRFVLEKEAEDGDRRAARAEKLAENNGSFVDMLRGAMMFVGFCAIAVSVLMWSAPVASVLENTGWEWLLVSAPVLAPIIIILVVAYVIVVFGDLLPRRIALANPEKMSKILAGSLSIFHKVVKPFTALTRGSAYVLSRLFGIKEAGDRQNYSEEEIIDMVTDNEELLDDEKRMIHEIINLGDTTVREVMQPRGDIIFAEDTETVRQIVDRMRGTGYSRIPVFTKDYDHIVGIVHYKDLMVPLMDGKDEDPVSGYMFDAYFVPEGKDIFPLLSEMQTNRQQIAIVVDEYGGTDGLITIEDIIEEIVGEIIDESDLEDNDIVALSDTEWLVDGSLSCEDGVKMGWPVKENDDYETIAGWLMDRIDVVPQPNDEFEIEGYLFKILQMRRHRIWAIRVKQLEKDVEAVQLAADDLE